MDFLKSVEVFVRVVDAGNLSRAARSLRRSLPAVSRQIDALERELGRTLLVRTTRRVHPTEAGLAFVAHARRLLREAEEARTSVAEGGPLRGTVVVSASVTLGLVHVVPHLASFAKKHPELSVELRLEDRAVDFLAEGVDVAVRAGLPLADSADLVPHVLATTPQWIVAAPSFAKKRVKSPRDLEPLPAVLGVTSGDGAVLELRRGDERASVRVRGPVRATSPIARREAAIAGVGFAMMPASIAADALEDGRLVRLLSEWEGPTVTILAVHRVEARTLPRVRTFVEHLVQTVGRAPRARAARASRA
jgi:DNA-binding transcriptional LysR family regulator